MTGSRPPLLVELGERSYPVCFAPLRRLGATMAEQLAPGRCAVVTNPVVGGLHGDAAREALRQAGWEPFFLEVPDGERHKTVETWHRLVLDLLSAGIDRGTPLVALGGGVTGDLAGFAAATALRGLPLVQVPTTLLAMVDSSVGGKTGVNSRHGKNLVGAFHQPVLVHTAVELLRTLPGDELRCGLGEVVKHAVLADPGFFEWLEEHAAAVLDRRAAELEHLVERCCAIKAEVVAADEREAGRRALLNLGHTVGHALEKVAGYGRIRHGEAVAVGMLAEARLAVERGAAHPDLPGRIADLLDRFGLPLRCPGLDSAAVVEAMGMDKKVRRGTLLLTVPVRIGLVRLEVVHPSELAGVVAAAVAPLEVP